MACNGLLEKGYVAVNINVPPPPPRRLGASWEGQGARGPRTAARTPLAWPPVVRGCPGRQAEFCG
eukprot:14534037-Heterocapsa_arctica.AAC.1